MLTIYKVLIAIGIIIVLFAIFVVIFLLNKKTKAPDCPKDSLPEGCASCMLSCGKREEDFSVKKTFIPQKKDKDQNDENHGDQNEEEK